MTTKKAGYHGALAAKMEATLAEAQTTIHALQAAAATTLNRTKTNTTPSVKDWHYCWTHGLGPNAKHTSATCTRKADGHQDTATMDNMMGGNNVIAR